MNPEKATRSLVVLYHVHTTIATIVTAATRCFQGPGHLLSTKELTDRAGKTQGAVRLTFKSVTAKTEATKSLEEEGKDGPPEERMTILSWDTWNKLFGPRPSVATQTLTLEELVTPLRETRIDPGATTPKRTSSPAAAKPKPQHPGSSTGQGHPRVSPKLRIKNERDDNLRLFVVLPKNRPAQEREEQFFQHFSRFGEMISIHTVRDRRSGQRTRGFVKYWSTKSVRAALTQHDPDYIVRLAAPRRLASKDESPPTICAGCQRAVENCDMEVHRDTCKRQHTGHQAVDRVPPTPSSPSPRSRNRRVHFQEPTTSTGPTRKRHTRSRVFRSTPRDVKDYEAMEFEPAQLLTPGQPIYQPRPQLTEEQNATYIHTGELPPMVRMDLTAPRPLETKSLEVEGAPTTTTDGPSLPEPPTTSNENTTN